MRIIASALTALSLAAFALGQQASSQAPSSSQSQSNSQAQSSSQQQQSSAAPASSGGSAAPSTTQAPIVTTITSFIQTVSLSGPSRIQVTVSSPTVIVSTILPTQPTASSGGGATQPAGNATSTSTTPTTYPTAASTVGPNGQGGQVAPSPGGSNPALGPDDDYISGARQIVVGGATILLGLGLGAVVQLM
ncbi:hypothetical protein RSOLAG1IB_02699 [Rhizoctonia solani AG-1 IB]|uniref:Uncharacterized protein n=1 Tax=Thanatephorus cucumeris (strain AG1-IB / isolate 7/3/14) TaxID=1108050 RepID=M5BNT3_THACB|nr:hypothetical protein BN14_03364 [Rhizoctonia solani AG-1 IB]CEL57954.1 hypothetical protein RSOLAG1IB_02699 [Rhizoctonia solani AG-1 IB]